MRTMLQQTPPLWLWTHFLLVKPISDASQLEIPASSRGITLFWFYSQLVILRASELLNQDPSLDGLRGRASALRNHSRKYIDYGGPTFAESESILDKGFLKSDYRLTIDGPQWGAQWMSMHLLCSCSLPEDEKAALQVQSMRGSYLLVTSQE